MNWFGSVGVRPEAVRISGTTPANGVVQQSTFLGNCVQIGALLDDGRPILAETSRLEGTLVPGQRAHFWWHPADELTLE